MVDGSTSSSDANGPVGSRPQRAADLRPGDVVYASPQAVFDDAQPVMAGNMLLVMTADEDNIAGVYLDQMSTQAVANQLPALAEKLTKPKVFFLGGTDVPDAVVALGQVAEEIALGSACADGGSAEAALAGRAQIIDADERLAQIAITEDGQLGVPVSRLRLFVGFTELSRTEVDEWLSEGAVQFQRAVADDVFGTKPGEGWRQLMKRRPFPENLFSTWAEHPERN